MNIQSVIEFAEEPHPRLEFSVTRQTMETVKPGMWVVVVSPWAYTTQFVGIDRVKKVIKKGDNTAQSRIELWSGRATDGLGNVHRTSYDYIARPK